MIRLARAELFRLRTTRAGWGMLALTLAFVACPIVFLVPTAGAGELPPLTDPDMVRTVFGSASAGTTFVLILGIIGMTGEYRHRTLGQLVLQAPRRARVIGAKLVAYAVAGGLYGLAAAVLVVGIAVPAMAARGATPDLLAHGVPGILGGSLLAAPLFALIGVGVGALIRNQVAAIAIAAGWLWLSESVVYATVPALGRWLPGGGLQAVVQGHAGLTAVELTDPLPAVAGAALLLVYAAGFAAAGAWVTARRDLN